MTVHTDILRSTRRTWSLALTLTGLSVAMVSPAWAQSASEEFLIKSLQPMKSVRYSTKRSFKVRAAPSRLEQIVNAKRRSGKRAFSAKERTEIAKVTSARPSVDLEVYFDLNSAAVSPVAAPTLDTLGRALTSHQLRDSRFLIAGHTDGRGTDAYNLELSRRRANSVRRFLMSRFNISPDRLEAIGYGEEQLKVPQNPRHGTNRRVQVVNMSE